MTHDPLCPQFDHSKFCEGCTPACGTCQCDLIAKVRADTLDNSTHDPLCPFPDYPYNICWVCELIAKVRADESKRKDDEIYEWRIKASDQYGHGFHEGQKRGRESALNQAREAVRKLPSTKVISYDDKTWHEPAIIERGKVIAAIDALLSKQ